MTRLIDQKLREYVALSPHVADLISPLKPLGIIGFYYIRVYKNGEILDLTARPDWSEHYFRQLFELRYPPESMDNHLLIQEGVNLWTLNQHNPIWQDGKNYFSYGNGITLCEHYSDYKELYSFYATAENEKINEFYLTHLDFLKKFKEYFVEKGAALITQAGQNKFLVPELYRPVKPSPNKTILPELPSSFDLPLGGNLTSRERECLSLCAKGLSALEIANLLHLSKRTVENYIANIKSKWYCSKTAELIHLATKKNLI